MKTLTGEQAQADNIISLFGQNILNTMDEEIGDFEVEQDVGLELNAQMEDVFSARISNPDLSLEMGFTVIADQLKDLSSKLRRTNFYLNDLENLLS
jgi:ABC-type phosphate transport system auxiliary subunit